MAVIATSTDYTGRQLDMNLSCSLNPLSSDTQQVTYSFGNPSQYIAGIQKLVQRYLISLINSGFIEQLVGSANSNISYATSIFSNNNWAIIQQFRAYQTINPNTNLDEQLNTVQLLGISSSGPDQISFSLQLISLAGTDVTFTLPLPL
jgi:hypothetical protein